MKYRHIISLAGIFFVCGLTYAEAGIKWGSGSDQPGDFKEWDTVFPCGIIMHGSTNDIAAAADMGYNTVHTWAWRQQPDRPKTCLRGPPNAMALM